MSNFNYTEEELAPLYLNDAPDDFDCWDDDDDEEVEEVDWDDDWSVDE